MGPMVGNIANNVGQTVVNRLTSLPYVPGDSLSFAMLAGQIVQQVWGQPAGASNVTMIYHETAYTNVCCVCVGGEGEGNRVQRAMILYPRVRW